MFKWLKMFAKKTGMGEHKAHNDKELDDLVRYTNGIYEKTGVCLNYLMSLDENDIGDNEHLRKDVLVAEQYLVVKSIRFRINSALTPTNTSTGLINYISNKKS